DHFKAMRANTLANLAEHLETFEKNATAAGVVVHWAKDGAAARQIVLDLARKHDVKLVAKSKSMATEEIHLNQALEEAGIDPIETDLGEYLIQLAGQPPSHIIAPAIHMTTAQAAALLSEQVGSELPVDAKVLMREARALLRQQFIDAGMGITGGNIMVAESGSLVLVMNEGNGRMVTTLPKIHVALVGLEKIVPTWDDAAV
ncbi:MAG: lactate utilization protein, partial [Anaerolineales bacterium]|nr:lactate utilization protein [Anaerolineales bacterium]